MATTRRIAPSRPAGADPRLYTRNPLVDDLRGQPSSTVYAEAARHGGKTPTLFPEGDLPHTTTSGISPHVLAALPWYGRHPVAAAATTGEAEDLIDDLSSSGHLVEEYIDHFGNRDYQLRVRDWSMRGISVAAHHRDVAAAAERLSLSRQQVAASASDTEPDDDELYDRVFGHSDRHVAAQHLEHLHIIAAGNAVAASISQQEARVMLEAYARGNQVAAAAPGHGLPAGSRIPIPADAAQRVLDRLDRELQGRWVR